MVSARLRDYAGMTSTSPTKTGRARSRRTYTLLTASLLLCSSPSLAQAAQRFAAPTEQGTGDCSNEANACELPEAFNKATTGDEVILSGNDGTYGTPRAPITSTLRARSRVYALDVHGAAGQPRPMIYSSAEEAMQLLGTLNGQGFAVSDIDIEHLARGSGLEITGTADHVLVHSTASGDAVCSITGSAESASSLTDSACIGDGTSDYALFEQNEGHSGTATITLRNDTFEAPASDSYGISASANGMNANLFATNVIAHGGFRDIDTFQENAGGVSFALDHCNYATAQAEAGSSITAAGTSTDQTAPPVFLDAAGDDFREAPSSPTIDAGADDPVPGDTDLDGNPRTIGAATDIGAFEASEAPGVSVGAITALTMSTATVNAAVNPNYSQSTYRVEYGPTSSYGSTTTPIDIGAGLTAVPVTVALGNLLSGTLYHYRLVGSNAVGGSFSPDQTFTTQGMKGPLPISPSRLSLASSTSKVGPDATPVKLACGTLGSGCRGTLELIQRVRVAVHTMRHRSGETTTRASQVETNALVLGGVSFDLKAGQIATLDVSLRNTARTELNYSTRRRLLVTLTAKRTDGGTPLTGRITLVLRAHRTTHRR
jgi:hypothetical protein